MSRGRIVSSYPAREAQFFDESFSYNLGRKSANIKLLSKTYSFSSRFLASGLSQPLEWAYTTLERALPSSSNFTMSGLGKHGGKGCGKNNWNPYGWADLQMLYSDTPSHDRYRSQYNDGDGRTTQPDAVSSAALGGVVITSANLETYLGKTATAGHVATLQFEMRALHSEVRLKGEHMMALKIMQDSRLDRIEALLATLVTPDNGTFTGDGPTTQPSSVSSAAAGGVVLTSANLDTCLGETATVTSLKNDMCGINDRLNRIEAFLATLPVTLVFPDNGTFTPSPAAPTEAGGDPKAQALFLPTRMVVLLSVFSQRMGLVSLSPCTGTFAMPSKSV